MEEVNRPMLAVYAAALLAVALIGARYLRSVGGERAGDTGPAAAYVAPTRTGGAPGASGAPGAVEVKFHALVVYVAGAVRRPGLVRLRQGDRVGDAVRAAGGLASGADATAVNLAAFLADGQQVTVPRRGGGGSGASGATGPISLNSATAEQLDQLDGIGPGLAQKIVAYRQQHGGFASLDALGDVPGIGEKRLESLRGQLQL